jgi:heme/copper-type cytochrome/quinol oxidase subunit 2
MLNMFFYFILVQTWEMILIILLVLFILCICLLCCIKRKWKNRGKKKGGKEIDFKAAPPPVNKEKVR